MMNVEAAYSAENFRKSGHEIIDMLADHLHLCGDVSSPTLCYTDPGEQFRFWETEFSRAGDQQPAELIRKVIDRSIHLHNRNYMGHQTAVPIPVTALTHLVAGMLNNGMGVYEMGMAGNAMEKVVTNYLAKKIGFGTAAGGFITSGGSLGNLTALLAAKAASHPGVEIGSCAVIICSSAHYSLRKCALVMGLPDENIFELPVNGMHKMQTDELPVYYDKVIEKGLHIICVAASACSTATGTYDDLKAVGEFCKRKNLWFHVDGAHGLPVMFSPVYRHLIEGVELADSLIMDFHKLMMVPSLSTAVMFKNGSDAYGSFSQHADYLWLDQDSEEWYNSGKRTFECTKTMGVLNVYMLFKLYSEEIFRESVEKVYGLAREFAQLINADESFELVCEPESNIVCFRYKFPESINEKNMLLKQKLVEEGKFYLVQTTIGGQLFLRVSIMNPSSLIENFKALLARIREFATQD